MKKKNDNTLEIRNLVKTYGDGTQALKGISLTVRKGEFFGLLGPNGAGKSTTLGIITSLVNKSSGSVIVSGHDIDTHASEAKRMLGVVPQEFNFNIFETCEQILIQQAGYYGISSGKVAERAKKLLDELGLGEKINTPSGKLSGGMKRRLMIARALIHRPKVLLLDEPTAGVDIALRRQMWEFLTRANKSGLTIILTTHNLDEAETLCERIGIINHGEIIALDKTYKLLDKLHSEAVLLTTAQRISKLPKLAVDAKKNDDYTIEVELLKDQSITMVIEELKRHKIEVKRMKNKSNRLEELFLRLVQQ